ncbi:MAG: hypothetical protein KKD07_07215 [Candidatus Omnitrophica bacterium]|nr:hypothetical protein [Candidatus Omnitrophota bacterium]MBU1995678.1 hypothetical protein [Candidatus Omnitrophota bacterium]MBU4334211.1 hypothetical protein [Candidatus Omnitrophota bacterium]
MNLKDLSNIKIEDLKNIDVNDIKDFFQKRLDISIIILLIIVILFVIIGIRGSEKKDLLKTEAQVTEMKEKLEAAENYKLTQANYDRFINNFPKSINNDQLSDKISELAAQNDVLILTFSPQNTKISDIIEFSTVSISITSEKYENIIAFTNSIENSPYSLRIEKWLGKSKVEEFKGTQANTNKDLILAEIEIGSVVLKDE